MSFLEKLRPQVRWSQTCRLPLTTVLGHSMYTAALTYFAINDLEIKNNREKYLVDSFYCALFHDLPESLTRDIISPVKTKIKGFEDKLSFYEFNEVNKKYISRIESRSWKTELLNLLGNKAPSTSFDYATNRDFILGKLVKSMDLLAAFMEAKMSVEIGVDSDALQQGIKYTMNALLKKQDQLIPKKVSSQKISFADFFASIPQFKQGV
jgi:putative hydrolase of HD superfamily